MVIDSFTGMANLYRNITLSDTVNNIIVKGEYAQMDREQNKAFVTDSALLILVGKQDSLFVHGDTLFMNQDSVKNQITIVSRVTHKIPPLQKNYSSRILRFFNK